MSGRYPEIVYTEDGDWPWNEAFFPKPSAIMGSEPQ
jgi:hypothetical protein